MKILPKSSNIGQFNNLGKAFYSPIKSSYKKPDFQTQWQRRQEKHNWFCQSLLSVCLKVRLFVVSINWLKAPGHPTKKEDKKNTFHSFWQNNHFCSQLVLTGSPRPPHSPTKLLYILFKKREVPSCYCYSCVTLRTLKLGGLEISGWRLIYLDRRSERIAIVREKKKYTKKFLLKTHYCVRLF